jgi:EmrB/QacA subfamily drug resistance transporter
VGRTPHANAADGPDLTDDPDKPTGLQWLGAVVLSLSLAIIIIDGTVLNVAAPTILVELQTTFPSLEWVISGYSLVIASLLLVSGRLGDQFGRRRLFVIGATIFGVGSLFASVATTIPLLFIGWSLLEGIGAACMMPATLALLSENFRGRYRPMAFALWGSVAGAAAAVGPLLGGWLTEYHSWRWAMRINLVVAAVAVASIGRLIDESRAPRDERRFDPIGVTLATSSMFLITFAFIESQKYGWWARDEAGPFGLALPGNLSSVPVALLLGGGLLAVFVRREMATERGGSEPLFRFSLLRIRSYRIGLSAAAALSLGEMGVILALSLYLQTQLHLSAFRTGLALAPLAAAALLIGGIGGPLAAKIGAAKVVTIGLLIEALGAAGIALATRNGASANDLIVPLALYGIGLGMASAQLTNVTLGDIPHAFTGVASGASSTVRQLGSALGVAITGTLLASAANLGEGASHMAIFAGALQLVAAVASVRLWTTPSRSGRDPARDVAAQRPGDAATGSLA